jgi:hypothetical protein
MAVMSAARRGAPRRRNGRYATRSTATAATPETAMATTRTATMVKARASPVLGSSAAPMPRPCMANSDANTPIMKISEWAKLMSRRTP